MAALGDVIDGVVRQHKVQVEKVDEDEYNVLVHFRDGRSQVVNVFVDDDAHGETWVIARSFIGDLQALDPVTLLERNAAPGYAFVAARDDRAFVCAQMPAASVDTDLCRRMLLDVAAFADALEEDMLGADDA